eukprot:scpid54066/ scgid8136/ Tigger transposable element-derived protein 2
MAVETPPAKRKRLSWTIDEKLKVLQELDDGTKLTAASNKYGIPKSTLSSMKKNASSIRSFKAVSLEMGMNRSPKSTRLGNFDKLEKALHLWVTQKMRLGEDVSGPVLWDKASSLAKRLHGEDTPFTASDGWKYRFCKRHGLRIGQGVCKQKTTARQEPTALEFVDLVQKLVEDEGLSGEQLFNCTRTGLSFRQLPVQTAGSATANVAVSYADSEAERVTLALCANAAGSCKLPVQVSGSAEKPELLAAIGSSDPTIAAEYGKEDTLMPTATLRKWFHGSFVPRVRKHLTSLSLEPRAVLLLDSSRAYPKCTDLASDDGLIVVNYIPAVDDDTIQPMSQGVAEAVHQRYRLKLLQRCTSTVPLEQFLNSVDMALVASLAAESWAEVTQLTLLKSWRNLIPVPGYASTNALADIAETQQQTKRFDDARTSLANLGLENSSAAVTRFLHVGDIQPAFHVLTEDDICDVVLSGTGEYEACYAPTTGTASSQEKHHKTQSHSSSSTSTTGALAASNSGCSDNAPAVTVVTDELDQSGAGSHAHGQQAQGTAAASTTLATAAGPIVSHEEAARMFEQCFRWLQQQPDSRVSEIAVLCELRDSALKKAANITH